LFRGQESELTVLDYWRWAHSNLSSNIERGRIAEYLVSKAAGAANADFVQEPWADWDVVLSDGTTVEVKCSSYIQDWDQNGYSTVQFRGLRAKELYFSEAVKPLAAMAAKDYKADLYALRVQHHKEHETFSVLNLSQWSFYVLTREELRQCAKNGDSVGLNTVVRNGFAAIAYSDLGAELFSAAARGNKSQ
jgi:hypothetical protein